MNEILAFLRENVYVIMAAIGAAAAIVLVVDNFKQSKYSKNQKLTVVILGFISLIIGIIIANMANWFLFRDAMYAPEKNYTVAELFSKAGFTFYFGLFGFFGALALLLKLKGFEVKKLLYYIVPAIPLFHGIARVGCAVDGCCYGITVNFQIGNIVIEKFPTQFCESLFLFILFFLLEYCFKKGRTIIYFTSYAVFRFLIEFVRGDNRGVLIRGIPLSPSQQIALAVIFVALVYLAVKKLDKKAFKATAVALVIVCYAVFGIVAGISVSQRRESDAVDIKESFEDFISAMNVTSLADAPFTEEEGENAIFNLKKLLVSSKDISADRWNLLLSRTTDIIESDIKALSGNGSLSSVRTAGSMISCFFGGSYSNITDNAYCTFEVGEDGKTDIYTVHFLFVGGNWKISYIGINI